MDPEAVTARTPRPVTRAMTEQSWLDAAFLHWTVDPGTVRRLLRSGLGSTVDVDLFDGTAHVGLIAFRMVRTRVLGSPPIPFLGTFCETNVRLYSVDERGRRAVVFRWMAAERLVPALIGRVALGLPYRWSPMSLERDGTRFTYTCAKPASRVVIEAGPPIGRPSPVELYLTSRWGLHTRAFGRTRHLANEHEPWALHTAALVECDDGLLAAAGIPGVADRPPDSVLYSPGVRARFGPVS